MTDGEFRAYAGLLIFSAVLLIVLAMRGFGQSTVARICDGVAGAAFLGYAGYLLIEMPSEISMFFYAFLAPAYAAVHAWRAVRRAKARRLAAGFSPQPYDGEVAAVAAQPFPTPPSPLGDAPAAAPRHRKPATRRRGPMPSGLIGAAAAPPAELAERCPARPSGLPETAGRHSSPERRD